ncbi:hypothetical protein ACN26Y_18135 [Micromonospora sp. WMMD558]|uniref:hypothetical protein n=1 Tax=unclassified Micromonospora TaxID=2617518 RepID=UPI0012B4C852|nr:hypothetical protein [Micromonospora sp. WMMC415]QGN48026.1 hypothetical protein GKC29_15030 [Micromonospora sp. WMMC415]
MVIEPGTWEPWDEPVTDPAPLDPDYAAALATARQTAGVDEAVITGAGRLGGRRVAVIAGEFTQVAENLRRRGLIDAVERGSVNSNGRELLPNRAASFG